MDIEEKIKQLNIILPKATPPVGSYVATKQIEKLLYISGQISVDGDGLVRFVPNDDNWAGVTFKRSSQVNVSQLHITGAQTGLSIISSDGLIVSNNVFENNQIGLSLSSDDGNRGRVNSILDNQIRNNVTGVSVNSTGANLERNIIVDNQSYGVNLTGGSCGGGPAALASV